MNNGFLLSQQTQTRPDQTITIEGDVTVTAVMKAEKKGKGKRMTIVEIQHM